MRVVAIQVADEQMLRDVEPRARREPPGRAGELGANRDIGLARRHLDQSRRQTRKHGDSSPTSRTHQARTSASGC